MVARSVLLKEKYIDELMIARSICLHMYFKSIKAGKMTDFHRVDYLIDLIFESVMFSRKFWADSHIVTPIFIFDVLFQFF